jgi:hypothetical protein
MIPSTEIVAEYYRDVISQLRQCRLRFLLGWLGGRARRGRKLPEAFILEFEGTAVDNCSVIWLYLMRQIPPRGRRGGRAPYLMLAAIFNHIRRTLRGIIFFEAEGRLSRALDPSRLPSGGGHLTTALARVPRGAQLLRAWFDDQIEYLSLGAVEGFIKQLYDWVLPAALARARLADLEELLRLGERALDARGRSPQSFASNRYSRSVRQFYEGLLPWHLAATNPHSDVFVAALAHLRAETNLEANKGLWVGRPMPRARYAPVLELGEFSALETVRECCRAADPGRARLDFIVGAAAGRPRDFTGGVLTLLLPRYRSAAQAARAAGALLAPDWPARLLEACSSAELPGPGGRRVEGFRVVLFSDLLLKNCCLCGGGCGRDAAAGGALHHGVAALLADPAFGACPPAARLEVGACIMGLCLDNLVEGRRFNHRPRGLGACAYEWARRAAGFARLVTRRKRDGPDPAALARALKVVITPTIWSYVHHLAWLRDEDHIADLELGRLETVVAIGSGLFAAGYGRPGIEAALAVLRGIRGGSRPGRARVLTLLRRHQRPLALLAGLVLAHLRRTAARRRAPVFEQLAYLPPRGEFPGGAAFRALEAAFTARRAGR